MKNFMLATGLCIAAAGQVAAQSAESNGSNISWDGYYLGLAVTSADVSGPAGTTDSSTQGFGLQFGYLRDYGNLVAGGEFAYVGADFDDFEGLELDSARLKAVGVTIVADVDKDAFFKATQPVRDKYGAQFTELMKRIAATKAK